VIRAVRTVLWSFLGVRRQSAYEKDSRTLSPQAVIGAGLLLAAAFVLALIGVVTLVTAR
jgi:Na+/H+ antiporter NhaB